MFLRKEEKTPDVFWQEYEEKTGEKVLNKGLGKYISGWDEFDKNNWSGLWGLVMEMSGSFRFHHFPQHSWIDAFTQFAQKDPPKEKTIFIPKEKIVSIEYKIEKKWWKKILSPSPPRLIIIYKDETDDEKNRKLVFEAEYGG